MAASTETSSEGISSILDTDLYKLTMQSAVLRFFPHVRVTYSFTNRTPDLKFSRAAFNWLQTQITHLSTLSLTETELAFLKDKCPYFTSEYLSYLQAFRFRPDEQIRLSFTAEQDTGARDDQGNIELHTKGLWVETILYEIPLLALVSEAFFKFCDTDWTHEGQRENAKQKGLQVLEAGCLVSEFGSRRRRDYKTHELVMAGLLDAQSEADSKGWQGKITGTSNVHFAQRFGVTPIGTMAHEWFMGVAAVMEDYAHATEIALGCWIGQFGKGVLGIALTDTFGTPAFLEAFKRPIRTPLETTLSRTSADRSQQDVEAVKAGEETYAQSFIGVRQDSGDPITFVKTIRRFFDEVGIKDKKTIVFSDSLNVERCIQYKTVAEEHGFAPSFGVGTFLTNDFVRASNPNKKSVPLNIVIKLSSADGKPAIKISDNLGKNTGNQKKVEEVKKALGYVEKDWEGGDEKTRWGTEQKS